jgi:Eco57I restriction-modification methylase
VTAAAVHAEALTVLVQLAAVAIASDVATLVAPAATAGSDENSWQRLLAQLAKDRPPWLELGAAPELPALKSAAVSDVTVSRLVDLGSRIAILTRGGLAAPTEQLGALHETLLALRFERLAARGLRLAASRHWVQPESILEWPAPLRAKRLAREAELSKRTVETLSDALAAATSVADVERALEPLLHEKSGARPAGSWVLQPGLSQRRSGAHYTPWPLCVALVEQTLAPLVRSLPSPRSQSLLELKVCDPAMGVGAFLVAAGDYLARALERALEAESGGRARRASRALEARKLVALRVLLGVDKNPVAVALARLALCLFVDPTLATPLALEHTLRMGDALVGASLAPPADGDAPPRSRRRQRQALSVARVLRDPRHAALDWVAAFPQAFERERPGLDALLGNPPWVAFVGRAAQPLEPELFDYFAATNPAFKRYRTLHGLFVYRCATLLRARGRLGLILPTSVADLAGYSETRQAHDALCEVDASLPDWGDGAFEGVFQPAMALVSTRRFQASVPALGVWPLAGCELTASERSLLERLKALPKLPPQLFGERGFQTTEEDQAYLRRAQHGSARFRVALREGSDVREFRAAQPSLYVDPDAVVGRLRPAEQWRNVALLIRQTARFPIAVASDGQAFRNSILAGFAHEDWRAPLLVVFLNSALARWLHYTLHRDAREGMPQLKIAHLRALPALPREQARLVAELERAGTSLSSRNLGIAPGERAELDRLVCDAFALDAEQRAAVLGWAAAHPPPEPRARAARAPASTATAG